MKDIIKNIIYKIKEFFKNIKVEKTTKKLPIKEENNSKEIEIIEKQNKQNQINQVEKLNNKTKEEKQRIFNIYSKIKEETIDLNQIEYKDLVKIKELLKEEAKLQSKKLDQEVMELKSLKAN